jgi:capsular exopolysaccharide synthesis family protein
LCDGGDRQQDLLRMVGITSCLHGEGVSTVAAHLAIHAALALPEPVLLVEAGTARPSLEQMFELGSSPGLVGLLAGKATTGDCVQAAPVENLSVLVAGSQRGCEVFHPRAVARVLQELREQFEFVIVDLPPTNEPGPCLAIAALLDGVLLTIEAERVPSRMTRRAKQELLRVGANLLGVVLNKRR